MSAFLAGILFGFCIAGWFYAYAARRPRLFTGGLDVDSAVRRPESRVAIARALKGRT